MKKMRIIPKTSRQIELEHSGFKGEIVQDGFRIRPLSIYSLANEEEAIRQSISILNSIDLFEKSRKKNDKRKTT